VLGNPPKKIDNKFLEQFQSFLEFRNTRNDSEESTTLTDPEGENTPEEALESAYLRLRSELEVEILEQIMSASPPFFERLVVQTLVAMGYGGSLQDAGRAVGGSGDGGIDGIIKEDKLGLDAIYLQAKRWDTIIGRPEIQKFAGALQGQRARKGVFITTSTFTKEAVEYTKHIDSRIVLIDGKRLAKLMVDHNVGVSSVGSYEIKKIDMDFFTED
jgi:restriction system protein